MKQCTEPVMSLLDVMFPGQGARHVPCFSKADCLETFTRDFDDFTALEALLPDEDVPSQDINLLLKQMKSNGGDVVERFIEAATSAYFSAPAVSVPLTGKPSPLFPSATALPEMDFTLLEPVLENVKGHRND